MHETTPFPKSFAGGYDLFLYFSSLGSVTAIALLMVMICGWMARDIWRDRSVIYPTNPVMIFRLIIMGASFTSFMRAMPEASYLYLWNEVPAREWQIILTFKRIADSFAIFPAVGWTAMLTAGYPAIIHSLKSGSRYATSDLLSPWPRLARPAIALAMAFVAAFLVAVSKLYLRTSGVAH